MLQVLPERESSPPSTPVAVGAVPGRWGWGLISVVVPFPAPHSPGELAGFAQVKDLPPVPSVLLRTNTRTHTAGLKLQCEAFPEITLMLVLVNPNSLLGPGEGTLLGEGTIPYTPIHVTRDYKITPPTAFSKLDFFPDLGMKCLLFPCRNSFCEGTGTSGQQLLSLY